MVMLARLRFPHGTVTEHYIAPSGHDLKAGDKVELAGDRDACTILAAGPLMELRRGIEYWTVTRKVR